MPNEDSRSSSSRRDGLRIGGWLETFRPGQRALTGRPPLVTPPPSRVPVFRPPSPPERTGGPAFRFAAVDDPRQVRLRVVVAALVVLAVGAVAFVLIDNRIGDAATPSQIAAADPVTLGAMPAPTGNTPAPTGDASAPPGTAPATTAAAAEVSTRRPSAAATHTATPSPTHPSSIAGLRLGDTLTYPAARGSRQRGWMAASFVARAAPVAGCVMLESTQRTGYFMHPNGAELVFERPDGSAQFRTNASFCPVPAGTGQVRLRSVQPAGHYVVTVRGSLQLAAVPLAQAIEFTVHPAA